MDNENRTDTKLFRQSSLEKISSPEDLNDYVRIANPGVWMILIAIVILLVGLCVWSFMAELETEINGVLITDQGVTVCYISENDVEKVEPGMIIRCGETEYTVADKGESSLDAMGVLSEYAMHVGSFSKGEWIRPIFVAEESSTNEEGTFAAEITIESVKPISFIMN